MCKGPEARRTLAHLRKHKELKGHDQGVERRKRTAENWQALHKASMDFTPRAKAGTGKSGTGEVWFRILNHPVATEGSRAIRGGSGSSKRPRRDTEQHCPETSRGFYWVKIEMSPRSQQEQREGVSHNGNLESLPKAGLRPTGPLPAVHHNGSLGQPRGP